MNDKVLQAVIKLKDEISKPLKGIKQNMENLNKATTKTKKELSDFTGGMKQVGKACAVTGAAITGAIGGVFAASSKVGMEFEASMSKVQAVMGASAEELKSLEKAARERGVDPSNLQFQLEYLWEESLDPNTSYGKKLQQAGFYTTTSAADAAHYFHKYKLSFLTNIKDNFYIKCEFETILTESK